MLNRPLGSFVEKKISTSHRNFVIATNGDKFIGGFCVSDEVLSAGEHV